MGYLIGFDGQFDITPPLAPEHIAYLKRFSGTPRVKRHAAKAKKLPDPWREAVGLPLGKHAEYFTGGPRDSWQDASVVDPYQPPAKQPSTWCQWIPSEDGRHLLVDPGGEKFHQFSAWLNYLITHFLTPWGYAIFGSVTWQGEESGDSGILFIDSSGVADWDTYPHIVMPDGEWRRMYIVLYANPEDEAAVAPIRARLLRSNIHFWTAPKERISMTEDEYDETPPYPDAVILCYSRRNGDTLLPIFAHLDAVAPHQNPQSILAIELEPCSVPIGVERIFSWMRSTTDETVGRYWLDFQLRRLAYELSGNAT